MWMYPTLLTHALTSSLHMGVWILQCYILWPLLIFINNIPDSVVGYSTYIYTVRSFGLWIFTNNKVWIIFFNFIWSKDLNKNNIVRGRGTRSNQFIRYSIDLTNHILIQSLAFRIFFFFFLWRNWNWGSGHYVLAVQRWFLFGGIW